MDWQKHTLAYYEDNAEAFVTGSVSADMDDIRNRFINYLPETAHILDFGCGSGRDTKVFMNLGFWVDAVDGSEELCRYASDFTGITVKQMLFQALDAKEQYDGIWACASILHLPKNELLDVMRRIALALKHGGILYTSFKYGDYEGMRNGRFFSDFTEELLEEFIKKVSGLELLKCWVTQDVRPGREDDRWTNILARRS